MIRALIVDDEELARALVREYLRDEEDIEITGECGSGFDAVKAIGELRPDLVFLDVQMPKLNGLEVLELIGNDIAVVFTTAHDQYATKAFDAAAVDYLLKPFDQIRFRTAVERARRRLQERRAMPAGHDLKAAALPAGQYVTRIVVKDGTRIHVIAVKDLEYAEAQDDYVALYSGGKSYLKQQTIASLERSLDPNEFVRIHRSYLVKLDCVSRIEPYTKDSRLAILSSGKQLPMSRAGYMRFRELTEGR
jgi:two-component system, LytTR family, response regulator